MFILAHILQHNVFPLLTSGKKKTPGEFLSQQGFPFLTTHEGCRPRQVPNHDLLTFQAFFWSWKHFRAFSDPAVWINISFFDADIYKEEEEGLIKHACQI